MFETLDKANLENIFQTDNTPVGILHKRKGYVTSKVDFSNSPNLHSLHGYICLLLLL